MPTDIREMAVVQLQALLDRAEIKGKGTFKPPTLDLVAIKERADQLDPQSQTKADIYMLLMGIEK